MRAAAWAVFALIASHATMGAMPPNLHHCQSELLGTSAGIKLKKTSRIFHAYDTESLDTNGKPRFYFEATRSHTDTLLLTVRTIDENGNRSTSLHAARLFEEMMAHFKQKNVEIKSIVGDWSQGTNLKTVNEATARGTSLEDAVLETWTSKQAAKAGYTQARVVAVKGRPGFYESLSVRFTRP